MPKYLSETELDALKKYNRAANYLAVAQIYLRDNVLLKRPLKFSDIKARLLGHWGTVPGINFVYSHINRLIIKNSAKFLYVVGPGHGFPGIQANLFIEKSLSKFYPKTIPYNEKGIREICSRFSAPYGYPSHSNPAAPGAILEGGELGYSLSVAYGSVLDNPDLITCCLVGDGEFETGPMAAAWHINKLVNPAKNGAVLPVVHVNGYKISGPTFLGRMSEVEIAKLFEGYGYEPFFVSGDNPDLVHPQMAKAMDSAYTKIREIQRLAREGVLEKPKFPVIILRTPKGWTGPKFDGDTKLEGNCKSHQVVFGKAKTNKRHLKAIEKWLKSYKFHELISAKSKKFEFVKEIRSLIPPEKWSCGTNPYAFGGKISRDLKMPVLTKLAHKLEKRGRTTSSPMKYCGEFLAELLAKNLKNNNLRIFSPDETYSNKIDAIFRHTARSWQWPIKDWDKDLSRSGKVMEMLSEHSLFGLHHGYSVTGRHGIFVSYESFVQIVASMADQYVKFIKASQEVKFRDPLPAVNVLLTSLLERQDHNGFSHQNPSFISSMMEKDGEIIHGYFPPDANCMLITMKECFESRDRLNVIVAGKKDLFNWLSLSEAKKQMAEGIMTWDFASDPDPQIVFVATGDYVTTESLAAIKILKELLPEIRARFVSVSELTALGVGDETVRSSNNLLDEHFTMDKGVIYNFHGYPHTIKKLLFDYSGAHRIQVNGYLEEGSTTSPFDMEVRNKTSRYHLVMQAADKLYSGGDISRGKSWEIKAEMEKRLKSHHDYILKYGDDPDYIKKWRWE